MSSQGPADPTAATTSSVNGGTVDWSNPTNVFAADGNSATATGPGSAATTFYLFASGFGFTVPAGATVVGVQVEAKKSAGGVGIKDSSVRLQFSSTIQGDEKADAVTNWPTVAAYASYGGAADIWGIALTPAFVNGSDFGVVIAASLPAGSALARLDHVRITVFYTTVDNPRVFTQVFSTPVHPAQILE